MRFVSSIAVATVAAWLVAASASAAADSSDSGVGPLRFRFTLDNDYSTSAGAFDTQGTLIRTLWSNRRYTSGSHEAAWDGLDDDGRPVAPEADYEIRVLTHNVIYTWDGVIGNTSPDSRSPVHHDGPYFFADLFVSGDRAFFTTPSEGPVATMRYFKLDEPQVWHALPALPVAYGATMGLVTADRERVYWAHDSSPWSHSWGRGGDQAFVVATDRDLSREIVFPAGTATCVQRVEQGCYRDAEMSYFFASAIDIVTEFREEPKTPALEGARNNVTGIAVQPDGPLLFVAHGLLAAPAIHVLDKRTGRRLARAELSGVGRLAATADGRYLWAIHDRSGGRVVSRLRIGSPPDYVLQPVQTLTGFESPMALALSLDGTQIVIADGGDSQQLKAFDAGSGKPRWTLGTKGGYRSNGPEVRTDKFSFYRYNAGGAGAQRIEQTVLGHAPDGSLWVGDTGLSRVLRFGADRRYTDEIAFAPITYNVAVDRNDPSRVFTRHKEYAVDYEQPIERSWRLVRYFGDGLPANGGGYHDLVSGGFADVATLRNGRTYGLLRAGAATELVEIPAEGDLKFLRTRFEQPAFMSRTGDLYSVRSGSGGRIEIWRRHLAGFNDAGVPMWEREDIVTRIPRVARDPRAGPSGHAVERRVAEIDPDLYVLFDPVNSATPQNRNSAQFHLGAARSGASRWSWRASPSSGRFKLAEPDGVFDASRPWYAGMAVTALNDQVVYNFHGEGWNNAGQANQFLHWYRDGLFIGQFGVPNVRGTPPGAAGVAGNSFSIQLAEAHGATWLWHNDENAHAGLHRWKLDGVEWIRELTGRGRVGRDIQLERAPEAHARHRAGAAPSALAARAEGRNVRLTWRNASGATDSRGVEVQRLQPTYVGPRFERIALLPPGTRSFLDADPLIGEPTVYRVRAGLAEGMSEYSNHVPLTLPARAMVLESQSFETSPPALSGASIVADPSNPANRLLRVSAGGTAEAAGPKHLLVRWKASDALYRALNKSVGRPRGSTPDLYRVELRLRLMQARLGPDSEVSIQVDPGYDLFSTDGHRQRLDALVTGERDRARERLTRVSFNFSAMPNGAGSQGLQQYRSLAPDSLFITFRIRLEDEDDALEFLVDDVSVSRLDSEQGGAS